MIEIAASRFEHRLAEVETRNRERVSELEVRMGERVSAGETRLLRWIVGLSLAQISLLLVILFAVLEL